MLVLFGSISLLEIGSEMARNAGSEERRGFSFIYHDASPFQQLGNLSPLHALYETCLIDANHHFDEVRQ